MADDDFNHLIPDLPQWNDGKGIDPEGWICGIGNMELAIGYSTIFWPRFVEFDGYVLLRAHFDEENLRGWERSPGLRRAQIEAVINHLHLADIHYDSTAQPSEAQLRYLGRILRECIAAKLKQDFPERSFEVVFNDEPDLDPTDYEVTFWQSE